MWLGVVKLDTRITKANEVIPAQQVRFAILFDRFAAELVVHQRGFTIHIFTDVTGDLFGTVDP